MNTFEAMHALKISFAAGKRKRRCLGRRLSLSAPYGRGVGAKLEASSAVTVLAGLTSTHAELQQLNGLRMQIGLIVNGEWNCQETKR